MANDPNLRVRISADLNEIKSGLSLLRGELAKVKQQSAQAFSGGAPNALISGLKRIRSELVGLVGAYASLAGGKMLASVADEATRVRGRIREAKGDYQALLALSNETRTGFAETVDLYARMERSTRNQHLSQERLMGITKTVNQAVKLSYADTNTATAALTQFAQGLAAGILRGQDLNSVISGTPVLAEAIAKGMGKQVGDIKKLGEAGKLTTTQVLEALEKQASSVEEEYKRVPVTIQDAFVKIRNSFVDYVGNADAASGASKAFANTLQEIAKDLPKYLDPLLNAIKLLIENLDVLAVFVGTRLALAAIPAMITAVVNLQRAFIALRTATLAWSAVAAAMGGPVGIAIAAIAAGLYLLYVRSNQARVAEEKHKKVLEDIDLQAQKNIVSGYQMAAARRQEARDTLEAAKAQLQLAKSRFAAENTSVTARGGDRGDSAALASTNALNNQRNKVAILEKQEAELTAKLHELEQAIPVSTVPVPVAAQKTDEAGKASKAVAESNALQRDTVDRAIKEIERLYKASEIGTQDYFAGLTTLQQQAIDLDILQAQNELKVTADKGQRLKLEEQIIILQRNRAEVATHNAQEEKQASDSMIDKLGEVKAKLAELDGDAGKAATIRIYAEYHDLFRQLELDSDETGKAMAQNLVDRLINKAKMDAIASKVSAVTGALSSRESSVSAQISAGTIGQGEGERQLQEIRQRSLDQLRALRAEMPAYLATMGAGSPEQMAAQQGLDELDTAISGVTASQNKFKMQLEDQASNALGGFFNDLIDGAKSFKDAFLDMVRSFVAGVAKMIAQELALRAVRSIMSAWGGGASANAKGNAFDSSGLRAFARGAVFPAIAAFAAGGAFTNQVVASPTLFAFGKGGQLGVMGEAGPEAIMPLERGPGGRLGVRNNSGAAPQAPAKVVVVFGEAELANALAGAAGEAVTVAHVRNNWGALNGG